MTEKEEGKKESKKGGYKTLSSEEIKKLAEDIYKGYVFTNRHIQDIGYIQSVFVPLLFLEEKRIKEINNDPPGLIYEYMSKAGPTSINGMPIFMSCRMISQEDAKKVFEKYEQIKSAIEMIQ